MRKETVLRLLTLVFVLSVTDLRADATEIRIGVLSHRGDAYTVGSWSPTADYLTEAIYGYRFEIVPLNFEEVDAAVKNAEVDFILVNPGIYVNLEVRYRVSRIATLNNLLGEHSFNVFGGVIFTRRDRQDITKLSDLKGKKFMAVNPTSLGGFQMAWGKLASQGIDPYRDFAELQFGNIHDNVVMAVRDGLVDAGTVRTNILERLASDHFISESEFRVISPVTDPDFPFRLSTRLYPEWPFSKVAHTSNKLAQKVAVALLQMPADDPAAIWGRYAGWTVPLDYQPVHDLFRELHLPPYENIGKLTLVEALHQYGSWLLLALLILVTLAFLTTWVFRLNRELERAKNNLEKRHHLILDSVADGICGVDLNGNTTFVNRAMEKITGWKESELIGRNQHELLHHTHVDGSPFAAEDCPVYATFRDNEPRYVDEDIFWKIDGASISVEYSSTPLRDERGHTVGAVVVFRDTTDRKRAQEDARQHQLEMAHVARLSTMGEMASGIAHELNQPLTAIASNSHACIRMLESGRARQDECADVMEKIAEQAERAGEIIRQIRSFVRKEEPERRPCSLRQIIREASVLFAPEARKASVRLRVDLDQGADLVLAQPIQIEQVILNLARNAIEAMADVPPDKRLLAISTLTRDEGESVEVTVKDSGPGLSHQIIGEIFDPFVTTKPHGMGLGLSISLGIIEAHEGTLQVESTIGEGAAFRFTLPAYYEKTHAA